MEAQKRSTDRLRRDLSDFRALVPEAEELKMEINEALMQAPGERGVIGDR